MSWALIHLRDVAPVPWRNGGGLTRELLAWPDAQDWTLRVSVAEVTRDGPFSRFPGVQRWFAVLSGGGVRLRIEGDAQELTTRSFPYQFDGGAATSCELLDDPTQDFNLMLRHGNAKIHRVSGTWAASCRAGRLLVGYANSAGATVVAGGDSVDIPPNTLAWRILDSDGLVELIAQDALWMEVDP